MKIIATMAMATCLTIFMNGRSNGQAESKTTFEPRTSPGAGQKLLEKFVGEWSVTKTFHPRTGAPSRVEGRCHQAMIHEGRFLQSDFVFEQGGKKSTGLGIIGFEPESGRFTSFWTDSRQTRMSARQSKEPFDGKQIVLYSRSLEADGKEARPSKTISRLEDDGRKLVHRQFSLGTGGEERLVMELVMIKESGAERGKK
jgi:hypothetical protein